MGGGGSYKPGGLLWGGLISQVVSHRGGGLISQVVSHRGGGGYKPGGLL